MRPNASERLRRLPKIDELLNHDAFCGLDAPRWALLEAIRASVGEARTAILAGGGGSADVDLEAIKQRAKRLARPSLRNVINATGVVLHTNLGRAPLASRVLERVVELCRGYCNLEYSIDDGARGTRHSHLSSHLCALTGAQDGLCVNNNAGAVMLGLAALACDQEVVVSRGELVEIGGSFRIPDIMRWSGARLVEVGTTNRTKQADYRNAIGSQTGLLLKVHRSNFAMVGFTAEVSPKQIAALGREQQVSTMMDLGSGALLPRHQLQKMGLVDELSVREVLDAGVDVVCFSGDKLLGGPQAGLIVGSHRHIAKMRAHPLMRVLRPDRLTIAAVEATLQIYRELRYDEIPILAMLQISSAELRRRAQGLCESIGNVSHWAHVEVGECQSTVGGGAMPGVELSSWAVVVRPAMQSSKDIHKLLREAPQPVISRIIDGAVVLDMRTVTETDIEAMSAIIRDLARK